MERFNGSSHFITIVKMIILEKQWFFNETGKSGSIPKIKIKSFYQITSKISYGKGNYGFSGSI